jgi:predicted GNAT family acetyltransferase
MKTCSKCKIEKDESEFYKRGDDKTRLRSCCKKCQDLSLKEVNQRYLDKNRDEILKRRMDKYYNDEDFRKKHLENHKIAYIKRRGKKVCPICGDEAPHGGGIMYCKKCSKERAMESTRMSAKNYRERLGREVINSRQNEHRRRHIKEVSPMYVAMLIRGDKYSGLKLDDIPKSVIDIKKNTIKLKREIKNKLQ